MAVARVSRCSHWRRDAATTGAGTAALRWVGGRLAFSSEKSRQVYERTLGVLVEASSSSSRGPANFGKYPIFMERGRGSRIYDVDGNEYIDWMMAFGALPLGHAHPEIAEAVVEAAATGAHFATTTPVELEVAER